MYVVLKTRHVNPNIHVRRFIVHVRSPNLSATRTQLLSLRRATTYYYNHQMCSSKQASVVISFLIRYSTGATTNWRVRNSQETTTFESEPKTIRQWRIVSFSTYLWASARSAYCWRGYSGCSSALLFFPIMQWGPSLRSSSGRTQARSQIALSTSGRHIEMISLPHPIESKQ